MEHFFVIVGRINSLLLLALLVGGVGALLWLWGSSLRTPRRSGAIEVAGEAGRPDSRVFLSLGRVEHIAGTDIQMMRLSTQEGRGKLSSDGSHGDTRNVLFLDGKEKSPRWLFPTQKNVILTVAQLRDESSRADSGPALALYVEYRAVPGQGDGKRGSDDPVGVALSRPDGQGFVDVISGASRILSYEVMDGRRLCVIYQIGKSVRFATFNLSTLAKEAEQEIVEMPERL